MFIFPLHLFNPGVFSADVVAKVVSGGTSLNGDETVIQTDGGGRWEGAVGEIDLDDPAQKRRWEAWTPILGASRPFLMPVPMLDTAPAPASGHDIAWPSDIEDDDEFFPTSVNFATPWIEAETVGSVSLRATSLTISVTRGSRLTPGMRFGVGARSYKIERITARVGQQAACILSTPVREPIEDGAPLNFDWPLVQCKAAIGQNLRPEYAFGFATVGFSFVEDFSEDLSDAS